MPAGYRHHTIKPSQGGALINVASLDNVGAENYVAKVNMRRDVDREVRREGWSTFDPDNTGIPVGLSLASITAVEQCTRANGDRLIVAASTTTVYAYIGGVWQTIGTGYAGTRRWEVVQVNDDLVFNNGADLPFTVSVAQPTCRPIYELRERGVSCVGTIAEYNGFLHCFDITEIQPDELNDWMNGATPYGRVTSTICNRIRQRHIWSEFGDARAWAPSFSCTLSAVTSTFSLPFPSSVFVAGETRVAVVGGGINGGTLGGETGYETGVLVTAVAGATITLEKETAAGITYPRSVRVMRFTDVSSIVGYHDMTDDGSAIIKAVALRDQLVLYRETGIFVGRYTAVLAAPFLFKRIYKGFNVPYYQDTVIEAQGVGHIYAGKDRFFLFDGIDEPRIHPVLDSARSNLFQSIASVATPNTLFSVQQPFTREVWICGPSKTLVYNFESKTCDEIDAGITAAGVMTGDVVKFALAYKLTPSSTVLCEYDQSTTLRLGSITTLSTLTSGLWSLGDDFNDKDIRTYCIQLASGHATTGWSITVRLYSRAEANEAAKLLFTRVVTPPDFTNGRLMIPVFFRDTFFQDELTISGEAQVELVARTIEVARVYTRGMEKTRQ